MLQVRKSQERGYADHGWLQSYHSFSFADYRDVNHMHFGPLRVINEDKVAPGTGFGTHGHQDMEIITYVLEGALAHKDSMGNASAILPGEVQRMSAGSGITHSEYNHEVERTTHLLQIWLLPSERGGAPSYEQKAFSDQEKRGRLRLVASPDGRDGSVSMQQNAFLYAGLFNDTEHAELPLASGRLAYVHVARGSININGEQLQAGDALKLSDETQVQLQGGDNAEVLVFDLPVQLTS
jgi:redox-sensitive bicupin YhaK (pirin superfamily)